MQKGKSVFILGFILSILCKRTYNQSDMRLAKRRQKRSFAIKGRFNHPEYVRKPVREHGCLQERWPTLGIGFSICGQPGYLLKEVFHLQRGHTFQLICAVSVRPGIPHGVGRIGGNVKHFAGFVYICIHWPSR
jgi:hypothetical protein